MPTRSNYDYLTLRRAINAKIHGRISAVNSASDTGTDSDIERSLVNSIVRSVLTDIDWRGGIRETTLVPMLSDSSFEYALPNDVKGTQIIDLRPQVSDCRSEFETYDLVSPREFDLRKRVESGIYTILDRDLTRTLRVSADPGGISHVVSSMEDSSWETFDSDAVNDSDVKVDCSDYTEGSRSIRFQTDTTDSTDTAVGVQNTSITAFDISQYLGRGYGFVDAKLTTADTGIHQITLRLGSDSNNYYQVSDSNQADCSAFQSGWNKIRFNFDTKTTVGSPADTAIDYAALFWSRDTTSVALLHLNDTEWNFDHLILKKGKQYLLSYYSRFPWQDTALALVENSTNDSHALLLQNDEVELIINKAAEQFSQFLRDEKDRDFFYREYERLKGAYLMRNPSQSGVLTSGYYEFGSLEGFDARHSDS
jgi:hypothetical protein